tara:strand:+ start:221 stop:508 length:288 start_codon:yes stop_codon:yes gene_type:complete
MLRKALSKLGKQPPDFGSTEKSTLSKQQLTDFVLLLELTLSRHDPDYVFTHDAKALSVKLAEVPLHIKTKVLADFGLASLLPADLREKMTIAGKH